MMKMMKMRKSAGILLALLVLALAILACGETSTSSSSSPAAPAATQAPATPPATSAPAKPKTWVTVQKFSGDQNTKTPSFQLDDGARIVWSATPTSSFGGYFSITSYTSDGAILDLIANATINKAAGGTYNVHGSNKAYLDISETGVSYAIQVQDYR